MPGLGDALSKAMDDSRRGLDDLVRRAAQNETEQDGAEPPPAADRPAAAGPVSPEEREFLVVPLDGARQAAAPEGSGGPDPAKTAQLPRPDLFAELADDPAGAPPEPAPDPVPARAPERPRAAAPAPAPAPAAASPSPANTRESRAAAGRSGGLEPIAPFAPSGVIRRQLRAPAKGADRGAVRTPDALLVNRPERRPLAEEITDSRRLPSLPGAEAYRHPELVRGVGGVVQALLSGRAGTPAVLAVCGAGVGAGCTTVAAATAMELAAKSGIRVLLVDADLRAPELDALAGEGGGPGFADVLAGGASLQDALVCSGSESLAVLPMGDSRVAADDQSGMLRLLEGAAPGRLLGACRGLFDAVILDAGDGAWRGTAMLAGAAGAAVLVVRSGLGSASEVRRTGRDLEHFGTRLIGTVLNRVPGREK